jgi:hypothetical protein
MILIGNLKFIHPLLQPFYSGIIRIHNKWYLGSHINGNRILHTQLITSQSHSPPPERNTLLNHKLQKLELFHLNLLQPFLLNQYSLTLILIAKVDDVGGGKEGQQWVLSYLGLD